MNAEGRRGSVLTDEKFMRAQQSPRRDEETGDATSLVKGETVQWYRLGRRHSWRELNVDYAVLVMGACLSYPAAFLLIAHAMNNSDERARIAGIMIYCVGFVVMFTASLMFHRNAYSSDWAPLYLFVDKMGINLMIAGSYTPLCVQADNYLLLALEWALVIFGFFWELALFKQKLDKQFSWKAWVDIARCVLAGWLLMAFIPWISPYFSSFALSTTFFHGVVFSLGVIFLEYKRMEFHFVAWHGFVFLAAAMYYYVVYTELSVGPPHGPMVGETLHIWHEHHPKPQFTGPM
jgi:hemolysin III